jgi:hypothetical protein
MLGNGFRTVNFQGRDAKAQAVATQFGAYIALAAVILSVYFK